MSARCSADLPSHKDSMAATIWPRAAAITHGLSSAIVIFSN
jgi:hypothetical protein